MVMCLACQPKLQLSDWVLPFFAKASKGILRPCVGWTGWPAIRSPEGAIEGFCRPFGASDRMDARLPGAAASGYWLRPVPGWKNGNRKPTRFVGGGADPTLSLSWTPGRSGAE